MMKAELFSSRTRDEKEDPVTAKGGPGSIYFDFIRRIMLDRDIISLIKD
jgi:hypothetical protein